MPHSKDFTPSRQVYVPTKEKYLEIYKLLLRTTLLGKAMDKKRADFDPLKIFTGIGQEAIGVAAVMAAKEYDWFAPDHRAMGVLLGRGITEKEIICHAGAFAESFFEGYDFGIHIASKKHHIIRFISDMGANSAVGTGLIDGLYYIRDYIEKSGSAVNPVLIAILGDAALSHSNAHSALEFASTRKLPILFIINNNGLGIKTGTEFQKVNPSLAYTAQGYGIPARTVDPANNVLKNYRRITAALNLVRQDKHGPFVLEFVSDIRASGHNAFETGEMSQYSSRELRQEELGLNPLAHAALQLKIMHLLDDETEKKMAEEAGKIVEEAFATMKIYSVPKNLHQVFAPSDYPVTTHQPSGRMLKYGEAITEALRQAMELDPRIRVFGEDVGSGGVHGITRGLQDQFGPEKVFNTPLDENGIAAYGVGLSLAGLVPCLEFQFMPFNEYAAGILKHYAGTHFPVTGESLPMVLRNPCGGGFSSNECHQKMNESEWAHAGGFKIVFPATAFAAKGLLLSAFRDGNPVIFCEQLSHYGKKDKNPVPEDPYFLPIGEAVLRRPGNHLSIITYGAMMVEMSLAAADLLEKEGIYAQVLDLQTIVPMDTDAIISAATKTKRVLVVHEAKTKFGVGAEIARIISEYASGISKIMPELENFSIKTKVLGAKDGPVAAHPALEKLRLPQVEDIVAEVKEMVL